MAYVFDIPLFREHFPAFTDAVKYPDAMIQFWADLGMVMLIECRWGNAYTAGLELYVAHNVALEGANTGGGVPGQGTGIKSGKTVGSTSIQYDTQNTTEANAGFWNLTTYGQRFYRISRMIGAGALQV